MPLMSILRYPAGTSKTDGSGLPSLMLLSSSTYPLLVIALMGKRSFWSIHAVLVPFLSVVTHLSQTLPFMVSVPTFLQVASALHGWLGSNAVGGLGALSPPRGRALASITIYMRCAGITIYMTWEALSMIIVTL